MKLNFCRRNDHALTAFELLAVIVCFVILLALLLPMLAASKRHVSGVSCVFNQREINTSFRVWAEDYKDQLPMAVSVTNGGAMELIDAGNLSGFLRFASNEMSSTKMFVCPEDSARTFATNWSDLNSSHVSYFLSADAKNDANSNMIFSGDDNIAIGSKQVASGLLNLSSNAPVSWLGRRHRYGGNILFTDGSFGQVSATGLQQALQGTGLATNRIVLP